MRGPDLTRRDILQGRKNSPSSPCSPVLPMTFPIIKSCPQMYRKKVCRQIFSYLLFIWFLKSCQAGTINIGNGAPWSVVRPLLSWGNLTQYTVVDSATPCSSARSQTKHLVTHTPAPISRALWENLIGAWGQWPLLYLNTWDQWSEGLCFPSFNITEGLTWPALHA